MSDDAVYELTYNDLQIIMYIFNEAANNGIIKAPNMENIGITYNRVANILKSITPSEDSDC